MQAKRDPPPPLRAVAIATDVTVLPRLIILIHGLRERGQQVQHQAGRGERVVERLALLAALRERERRDHLREARQNHRKQHDAEADDEQRGDQRHHVELAGRRRVPHRVGSVEAGLARAAFGERRGRVQNILKHVNHWPQDESDTYQAY